MSAETRLVHRFLRASAAHWGDEEIERSKNRVVKSVYAVKLGLSGRSVKSQRELFNTLTGWPLADARQDE